MVRRVCGLRTRNACPIASACCPEPLLTRGRKNATHRKLWETLKQAPILVYLDVEIKPRPNRVGRQAMVTVHAATVNLAPSKRTDYRLPGITANTVLAREETPPQDVEALEWLLVTSLAVGSFEQAMTVVAGYAVRWCIEVYFHVLKSGCQIKRLQLETEERLLPCLALYMIIAWRVLFTLMAGTHLSGSRLRGDFRAPGMAGGLYRSQTLFTSTETAPLGRTGLLDSLLGRLSRT